MCPTCPRLFTPCVTHGFIFHLLWIFHSFLEGASRENFFSDPMTTTTTSSLAARRVRRSAPGSLSSPSPPNLRPPSRTRHPPRARPPSRHFDYIDYKERLTLCSSLVSSPSAPRMTHVHSLPSSPPVPPRVTSSSSSYRVSIVSLFSPPPPPPPPPLVCGVGGGVRVRCCLQSSGASPRIYGFTSIRCRRRTCICGWGAGRRWTT